MIIWEYIWTFCKYLEFENIVNISQKGVGINGESPHRIIVLGSKSRITVS